MQKKLLAIPVLLVALTSVASAEDGKAPKNPVAVIVTSMGEIHVELWPKAAPKTVENFLDLAEGRKEWKDPATGKLVKRPFYDGLIFHRVIKNFMLQAGCPIGTGEGDAGYTFEDEINGKGLGLDKEKAIQPNGKAHPSLVVESEDDAQRVVTAAVYKKLGIVTDEQLKSKREEVDKLRKGISLLGVYEGSGYSYDESLAASKPDKGVIAMANAGPNTNSSQFFLNLVDTPWLAGKHTVFGKIVKGMEVVEAIGKVKVNALDSMPAEEIKIVSIRELKEKKDEGEMKK
ncbi:MAG: peptidyl-prolyl cis-trans isomerase A [Planctomycetota bacterium]|nr:MAG: peptidyl-prolyl cis-trans isomerase A [Planctomycetota bacterium]